MQPQKTRRVSFWRPKFPKIVQLITFWAINRDSDACWVHPHFRSRTQHVLINTTSRQAMQGDPVLLDPQMVNLPHILKELAGRKSLYMGVSTISNHPTIPTNMEQNKNKPYCVASSDDIKKKQCPNTRNHVATCRNHIF